MKVEVKAKINPSEDPEKLTEALKSIFPTLDFEIMDDRIFGESNEFGSLEVFKNKLGLQSIRDSARRKLKKSREDNKIRFFLNKQAAFVHKVNFSDGETPLGPIEVVILAKDLDRVIDYLAPSKEDR